MTPKEKAGELLDKFDLPSGLMSIERKQCALITVDEILEMIDEYDIDVWDRDILIYYKEVKQEIKKL